MTDEGEKIAVLKNQADYNEKRIESLEANQKWGVLTILGLAAKALFDFVSRGQP